jgi:hypothetical protein
MSDDIHYPDNSDNVLAFTARFDSNSDIRAKRNLIEADRPDGIPYHCTHMGILVDKHFRQLTCRRCGAVVDAFDWIYAVTAGETKIDLELRSLRREIQDHREGLEKLKREEVNCRARIKNAQFRLNDVNLALIAAGEQLLTAKGVRNEK